MKIAMNAALALMCATVIVGCGSEIDKTPQVAAEATKTNADSPIEVCVRKGIEYYKEIGSYPTLTSAAFAGRSADEVAREKCNRTGGMAFNS